MKLTPYHAKYFAYELTKRSSSESVDKLASALSDAQVDLNPHQIEAALFAFRSPLSKGAILADEVGLGKTIEAGILLAQRWAERRRRLLVICPANLRKQWSQELVDKFYLPSVILETRTFNEAVKRGNLKLPGGFEIDTPVGKYNPDWAIVKHEDETLYLVRGTKSTKDFLKLRTTEADKVRCGEQHFKALDVPFAVVVDASGV
jgi:hypothetical protein